MRLADASHAQVLVLEARGLDGSVVVVCGPPGLELGAGGGGATAAAAEGRYSSLETKSVFRSEDGVSGGKTEEEYHRWW